MTTRRLIGVGAAVLLGGFAAVAGAQVRIAPPEATGVARRAEPEGARPRSNSDSPAASPARSGGSVQINLGRRYFAPGFATSRFYYPRGFYDRDLYLIDDGYYGPTDVYCYRCRAPFGRCGCGGSYVLPPVYADAGQAYGPRAAIRFLLGDPTPNAAAPRVAANAPLANNGAVGPMRPAPARVAAFGDQARGRAWKFIDYGDKQFKKGRHREAAQRYRKATAADGELGEAQFRLGWAELAMGRIGRASIAFRRGLPIDPAWPGSDFVLEDLFDDKTRAGVFKQLDERLEAMPNDVDARFVLGVAYHFDGRPAEAQREFARVVQLTGGDPSAQRFLPPPEPPADPAG